MSSLDETKRELRLDAVQRCAKISRSSFFNFVRFNRLRNNYPSMHVAVRESAKEWRSMSLEQKRPFRLEASSVPRNTTKPAYFILGEQVLGKRVRNQLAYLKAHFERHLDAEVDRALKNQGK